MPTVTQAQEMIADLRPKIETIVENFRDTTTVLRSEVQRVDATVNDVIDRARLQVIRADELLGRTMDRVEQTSEMVHRTVVSPVKQISGLVQGITVGLEFLFSGRNRRNGGGRERRPVPQDEMFI
jgi:methyl-accepting chemotaxis protein